MTAIPLERKQRSVSNRLPKAIEVNCVTTTTPSPVISWFSGQVSTAALAFLSRNAISTSSSDQTTPVTLFVELTKEDIPYRKCTIEELKQVALRYKDRYKDLDLPDEDCPF